MTAVPAWRAQRERGSGVLMRLIVTMSLKLGRPLGCALLYPISAYFLLFSGSARAASSDYLRRILGRTARWRELFHHYHCFARQIHDRVYLLAGDIARFECAIDGLNILEEALTSRRGVVLLGAHVGSFEIMRVLALARFPVKVRVLMYEPNAEKLAGALEGLNPDLPGQIIALGRPEAMLEVREAAECGEVVSILGDRVIGGDRVRRCRFLGQTASFPEGPFVLAAALRAPIVLFSALRDDDGRYRVRFEPFT